MKFSESNHDQLLGLQDLDRVELNPKNRAILDGAFKGCAGDTATRHRKHAEANELLALSQIAPPGRLIVQSLDLREDLRALLLMQVPVACLPDEDSELQIVEQAMLGFIYPNLGFQRPLPGHVFFQIMLPRNVWLAQIKQPEQALCIAPQVPAGSRTALLLLRAYGALSMQSIQIDAADPAGVFNSAAARWWQENIDRVPLTTTALLDSTPAHAVESPDGHTPEL